jgi:hypothetical protein
MILFRTEGRLEMMPEEPVWGWGVGKEYRWIRGLQPVEPERLVKWTVDAEEPWLSEDISLEDGRESERVYSPDKVSKVLFRRLADVEPIEDGILDFAREHGLLTAGTPLVHPDPARRSRPGDPRVHFDFIGEPISLWQDEIEALRTAVHLWEGDTESWVRTNEGFQQTVKLRRLPRSLYVGQLYQDAALRRPLVHPDEFSSPSAASRTAAKRIINAYISGRVFPRLLGDVDGRPVGGFYPADLIGAIWLQFFEAVRQGTTWKRCEACGKWMDVPRSARARTVKKYCSGACNSRAHRERKAAALAARDSELQVA